MTPAPQSPASPQAADPDATITRLKAAIFDAFAITHIAEAQVEYDTDGDDGALQVHPCTFTGEDGHLVTCPAMPLPASFSFLREEMPNFGGTLADAVTVLVTLLHDEEPCVWTGEDAAYGMVQFFAVNRTIRLEHTRRFHSYKTLTRTF